MGINYLEQYYKSANHDLSSLIVKNQDVEEHIQSIKREISKLQKTIEGKRAELSDKIEKAYTNNFNPISSRIILEYEGRGYGNKYYFDINTGLNVDYPTSNDIIYSLHSKSEELDVVVGYSYNLASIVVKTYKCTINRDNTHLNTRLIKESIISFMEDKKVDYYVDTETTTEGSVLYGDTNALQKVKDNEFINTLYGVDYKGKYDLKELRDKNLKNKSFEIILKTSPKEIEDELLNFDLDKALPIHKIIGISLDTYNKALDRGVIDIVFKNRQYINNSSELHGVNKTESEWLDIIEEVKHYEEDLSFYNIEYEPSWSYRYNSTGLLYTLLNNYCEEDVFKQNYSFNKFMNYVVNETINQGYTNIRYFIDELRDYLRMCRHDNIKPTLYSSYLKQTHDITSRNHNIIVEQAKEDTFKSKYADFKEYFKNGYYVVAPKNSNDLKLEGDVLNHCVASYIKRVIDGECLIYFLRTNKEESLITFEVRHNTIVQVKGLHNRKPSQQEILALNDFAIDRKLECNF